MKNVQITKKEIINSLNESIISNNLHNITKDLIEVSLDTLLKGTAKEIPIINILYSFVKIGIAIRDRALLNKILTFLFNIKDIPKDRREKFIQKFDNSNKYRQKISELHLIYLDKYDYTEKAEILAKLVRAKIDEKISANVFLRPTSILDRLFLPDLEELKKIKNEIRVERYDWG